jgi:nucleoside diphosphate kinase
MTQKSLKRETGKKLCQKLIEFMMKLGNLISSVSVTGEVRKARNFIGLHASKHQSQYESIKRDFKSI